MGISCKQRGRVQDRVKDLPADFVAYKRTPEFSELSVPGALLDSHSTKKGTWGEIVVLEGCLTYRILEPVREELVLDPQHSGIVEPLMKHEIAIHTSARFYIQFYRKPVTSD